MKRSNTLLRFLIFFLVLIIVAAFFIKQQSKPKIVCFGDSITFGAQVNGHSWVYYLNETHNEYKFVNAGRNGRTTADRAQLKPVLEEYPDATAFLFFLGVNDLKNGTDSMVNSCVENMHWMIKQVRSACPKARIIILAPSGIHLETMSDINKEKKYNENTGASLAKLEKRYKQLSETEGTGFISLLRVVSPNNFPDGLHPNENGQQEIAAAVWEGWKKPDLP